MAPQQLADTVILRMTSGAPAALAQGDLLIDSTTAKTITSSVGDTVPVKFAYTGPTTMRIGGIYQANALIGSYLVSTAFFLAHFKHPRPAAVLLRTTAAPASTRPSAGAGAVPDVQVQTRASSSRPRWRSINQLLGLVYALLALAVLIALIGIVNTLMLSVLERTREIGLLRAVGMRATARSARMIRSESVILASSARHRDRHRHRCWGLALVSSLRQQGITETAVPVVRLVVFLVLAGVLGLVAASWPARRAARLDVLAAIAAQ